MIYSPDKYKKDRPNVNKELSELEGELTDEQAKAALGRFLRHNLGIGLEFLTNKKVKLAYYQELLLKALFNANFSMIVASRGGSKSFIAAMIAFLYPLFNPGTNIVICGPTFRTARHIFNNLEKIVNSPEGILLKKCFAKDPTKRNDAFEWEINGGVIRAIPMNSEKLRGFRAQVLILDEFLLFSKDVVEKVLMPFLIVPENIAGKIEQDEKEQELIDSGAMRADEKMVFPPSARMICLTSACYTFEYAYEVYKKWLENTFDTTKSEKDDGAYFVAQLSWKALPSYFINKSIIQEATAAGEDNPNAKREFGAQFIDGSDSYFSALRMNQQTIKDQEEPTVKLYGDPSKEYILSIDPSWSQAPTSDDFAMSVLEKNEDGSVNLVHGYAVHGGELNEHIKYLMYLLKSFNIVLIIADSADGNLIQSANESQIFIDEKIKLGVIDYDGSLEGEDYNKMLKEVRKQYNLNDKRICIKHIFNSSSIRRINEQLQTFINTKKLWFASKLTSNKELKTVLSKKIPYEFIKNDQIGEDMLDLISVQDMLIVLTKKECSLIEVSSNPTGGQKFDLPTSIKKDTKPDRTRKDNYTSLMLGIEGFKAYTDIMRQEAVPKSSMYIPQMFGKSTR
jgi:hypothetical protein